MASLLVSISTEDLAADEHDEQAADLGRRLRGIDGAALSTIAGAASPQGSKAAGGALIGAFSLTVATSRKALGTALEAIRAWVTAVNSRAVVVELDGDRLEIKGASGAQIDRAMDAFLDKHSRDDP